MLPTSLNLPEQVSIAVFAHPPGTGQQPIRVVEFQAISVGRLSQKLLDWPQSPFRVDSISFDGENLALVGEEQTIRFHVDSLASIAVYAFDFDVQPSTRPLTAAVAKEKHLEVKTQSLTAEVVAPRKSILGPVEGAIFTPPREYYIRRDIKQILALVVGLVMAIVGLWLGRDRLGFRSLLGGERGRMSKISRTLVAASAATIFMCLAAAASVADTADSASRELLLDPALRVGQTFQWTNKLYENGSLLLLQIRCEVASRSAAGSVMRVAASLNHGAFQVASQYGFTFRDGISYGSDGAPLQGDNECFFYSVSKFGVPPESLKVGSTWSFSYPADYHSTLAPNAKGTTTVTELDPSAKTITLKVTYAGSGNVIHGTQQTYRESHGTLVVKIANGGVITDQTIQNMLTLDKLGGTNVETNTTGGVKLDKSSGSP